MTDRPDTPPLTAETLVKITGPNGEACHGGTGKWPLPRSKRPGAWLRVEGPLVPCWNGLHICTVRKALKSWPGPAMWRVEHRGEVVNDGNKLVVREARLLSRVETWNDCTLRLFAADCAADALNRARVTDARAWGAVDAARAFARGEISAAARDAALAAASARPAAARAAAWDAGWDEYLNRLLAALNGNPPPPIERMV